MSTLYPDYIPHHSQHPSATCFEVVDKGEIGKALTSKVGWERGQFMARFDGVTVPTVFQHTLQKTPTVHILDKFFIGMLAHSCEPNVMLDMEQQEMWAVRDIHPGEVLSMDYASTEDHLFVTFQCGCGTKSCRGFVTGRKQRLPQPVASRPPVL